MRARCFVVAAAALIGGSAAVHAAEELVLFNGRDLTGWVGAFEPRPGDTRRLEDVWSVKDGAITCSGGQGTWASVHTQREFTNFRLQLEFRWLPIDPEIEKKGGNIYNSGVFFRSKPRPAGAPTIMPIAYQTQLVHTPKRANGEAGGGTGDLWITSYDHPAFKGEREGPPRQAPATGAQGAAPARASDGSVPSRSYPRSTFAEKPLGEWNAYDITFNGDRITVTLNGQQVNSGTGAGIVPGRVGLECENTPIAFRNIRLTTLD